MAWKELWHSRKKYALVTMIVVLMMFMVIFLSGLLNGLGRANTSGVDNIDADTFVLQEDAEKLLTVSSLTEAQVEEITAQAGGQSATLNVMRLYLEKADSDEKMNIVYFGIDADSFLDPAVYEGNSLAEAEAENPIVLDDDFESKGIAIGDIVKDSSSGMEFTVVGFTKDRMYSHVSIGYITHETYFEIMRAIRGHYENSYSAVVIQGKAADIVVEGASAYTKSEIRDSLPSYKAENITISMVDWALVVITAVVLGIFFYIINIQKRKQFGIIKAIGFSNGRIGGMITLQVASIAIAGAALATILVALMGSFLPDTMPFYLNTENVLAVLMTFILISLMGGLVSVIQVSRIDPAEIIGGDSL